MSSETYTSVTHHSYGSRISGSFQNLCGGIVIGLIGIVALVWNEGHYVQVHKAIQEGLKIVVDIDVTQPIDKTFEGRLVHGIGEADNTGNEDLMDPLFGVTIPHVLKLKRIVEMYQWVEHQETHREKQTGGSTREETTYTYDKTWRSDVVNSNSFYRTDGHINPDTIPFPKQEFVANPIQMGQFTLSNDVLKQMNWYHDIDNNSVHVDDIPTDTMWRDRAQTYNYGKGIYFSGSDSNAGTGNPNNPQIGDVRVIFQIVPEQTISIVARQTSNSFSYYTAKSGGKILLVEPGYHDATEMFQHAHDSLVILTWIIRFVGCFCIFIMFKSLTEPLTVVADVLPFVGNIVGAGGSLVAGVLAFSVSIVVIALAWLWYRPLISILLLAVVLGLFFGLKYYNRGRSTTSTSSDHEYIPTATVIETYNDDDGVTPPPAAYNPSYSNQSYSDVVPLAVPVSKESWFVSKHDMHKKK